ncbi:hypothetical protein [Roseimicrobium sp. ORNL1]|uniref:hypothetical protein n=1 Tax=Roseimicrobium sp. ORNL1 TaxID=2711231 RepID=UPI00197DDE7F|nr:hypothetical protein [Roseimicrobium sp. ORNL1]
MMSRTSPKFPFTTFVSAIALVMPWLTAPAPVQAGTPLPSSPDSTSEVFGKMYQCHPGPWGQLEYYYIYLEAPPSLIEHFPMPNSVTKWEFPGETEAGLRNLFTRASLPQALQDYLLDSKNCVNRDGRITVFPPLPDLSVMTPAQRSIIYAELARAPENEFYVNPVFITSGSVDQWLGQSRLTPELREIIKKFTYMRGEVLAFSDLSAVLNYVKTDAEAKDFFKTMTRTRSLMVRLVVDDNTDLKSVIRYWSGRKRNKDIEPLVTSTIETEGTNQLDIIHLLPSLARRYLYGYPPMELAVMGRMPDCHWSSLNFFNYKPREYYLDTRLATSAVLENYNRIEAPFEFGDVLMFLNAQGNAIHSCVYIADDIVYTKNGENMASPWLLMKISDVQRIYSYEGQTSIQGFRLKPGVETTGGEQ